MKGSRKFRREKGFTLIELMVVMSILAVLAAMVFPTVTGMKTGGETAAGKGDAKEVQNAIGGYNTADTQGNPWPDSVIACDATATNAAYTIAIVDSTRATNYTKKIGVNITTNTYAGSATVPAILAADATALGLATSCADGSNLSSHSQINWKAVAKVRQKDGSVQNMNLVPDYLASQPKSSLNVRGDSVTTAPSEFVWLLMKGTELDGQGGRSLQVLRLSADGLSYTLAKN